MSKIEVDQVDPQSGTTLTLGTSGDTVSIPSGVTLANAGTATGFASIAWQSSIVTAATHTASAGQGLWLDTSSNAITLTLPASPSVGDQLIFTDYARNWDTNAVTLSLNGEKFQGNTSPNPVYNTKGQSVDIVYSGATKGWIPNSDDDVTLETPQSYSADFLVIAGGASGSSSSNGGGGGAGGFRTSTQSVLGGQVYTITVGDGGASVTGSTQGNNGSDSSISGSGITTITSTGGGGGGRGGYVGSEGGSGGGGGNGQGAGSGNTPSTSPSQGNNGGSGVPGNGPAYGAGGGGGAGAVGEDGSTSKGGNGGDGASSSITGSAVTRAGGGGGATNSGTSTGGAGGGGNGAPDPGGGAGDGFAGTANTGSGGGGAETSGNSGAGGKGVVIISVPTSDYSSITTGSPTVTTSGSNTILQFNGSGSYTA